MRLPAIALLALIAAACDAPGFASRARMLDPQSCAECHAEQVRQWSASAHARAADDPVFAAMNARGQRDTGGALGAMCARCHAPIAVLEAATVDGTNLGALPAWQRGVTCYACHAATAIAADHNNGLVLGTGVTMRGPSRTVAANRAHPSAHSALLDGVAARSADLCGSCHDVVLGGDRLERTHQQWRESIYANESCARCHMEKGDHRLAGSLTDSMQSGLCVEGEVARVLLRTRKLGHGFPGGAAHNHRLWVEVIAYRDGAEIYRSGVVAAGQAVSAIDDPDLWLMRDCLIDRDGRPVNMLWQATGHRSDALEPRVAVMQRFPRAAPLPAAPDRITARVLERPIGLEVLDDLIASGDLDPAVRGAQPTHVVAALEWTPGGPACVTLTQLDQKAAPIPAPRPRCD